MQSDTKNHRSFFLSYKQKINIFLKAFNDPSSSEYQYLRNFIFHFLRNLIDHENGSLVVQKCLEKYHSEDFLFILNYINDNVLILYFLHFLKIF